MNKITIIDYGVGNLASLKNALDCLSIPVEISSDETKIRKAEKLILPGVGAFAAAMKKLTERRIDRLIIEKAENGTPVLGICLGMQLLMTKSFEQGEWRGLNLIPGEVHKFRNVEKIPHMGWNSLSVISAHPLFRNLDDQSYFYFVHSYYCCPDDPDHNIAECNYGEAFCSAVAKNHIVGVQFHPEKSQSAGLRVLMNFAQL